MRLQTLQLVNPLRPITTVMELLQPQELQNFILLGEEKSISNISSTIQPLCIALTAEQ
jgi:hypothetical protein